MKTLLRLCVFWVIILGLAACKVGRLTPTPMALIAVLPTATFTPQPSDKPGPPPATLLPARATGIPPNTFTPPPTETETATPTPIPTALPFSHYGFDVAFDYLVHELVVTETIVYVNAAPVTLNELLLVVESNRQAGVFMLDSLAWDDGTPIPNYVLDAAHLRIPLRKAMAAGETVTLRVGYTLRIPSPADGSGLYGSLSATERQTNLGDWYPYLPPFSPELGWLAYEPANVGEHQVFDPADFDVDITVTNAPDNLTIAASGWGQQVGNRYRFQVEAARSFAWSASTQYVVNQTVLGTTLITTYAFPEHARQGQSLLQVTANSVALYGELFAPYPHASLAVVEADFFDGMEYDGLYFLGKEYFQPDDGSPKGYLTALGAHETAHQWWYGLVGNDQAMAPWLDEALCTYSEHLYYERYAPDLLTWWWDYRSDRFKPEGWVNSTIYDLPGFRDYVNAVYLRGAHFLEDLRLRMGDEAFFAALKDYTAQNTHRIATPEAFFAAFQAHTNQDFSDLVGEYFR